MLHKDNKGAKTPFLYILFGRKNVLGENSSSLEIKVFTRGAPKYFDTRGGGKKSGGDPGVGSRQKKSGGCPPPTLDSPDARSGFFKHRAGDSRMFF